jgi:ribonuclease BN (tRNA processing enzyme)
MPELVFVGTGDAFGSGGRRNSAILVRSRAGSVLLDCGPTTLSGLKALGVDPLEIDAIVVSHYHGDHTGGIPFLLIDYLYQRRRERPLQIVGPQRIAERVDLLLGAFEYKPEVEPGYKLELTEYRVGHPMRLLDFELEPLPAFHHPHTHPHMLRLAADGRQLFFTGDTGWHEALPGAVGEADLFISECVLLEEGFEYHLSHQRLDAERARFRAGRTILTHLGSEVLDNSGRVRFDLAHDGLRLKL